MLIAVGAAGTPNAVFDNLATLYAVNPQPEYARTFMLSPVIDALFEANVNTITLELVASPESKVTPDTPPTEVGNIQLNPVAFAVVAALNLYFLAPHKLLINTCVIAGDTDGVVDVTFNCNLANESQPAALVVVKLYKPLTL